MTPAGGALDSTPDPLSQVKLPDGEARLGLSYDWALHIWVPVPFELVSPDGSQYVYTDSQSRIHLVKLVGSSDSIVASGVRWGLYAFKSDGIYAGQRDPSKQPSLLGLWRIPSTGGTAQQLVADGSWTLIGADAAWSVWQDGAATTEGTVLVRIDLKTGQSETWYTSPAPFRIVALGPSLMPVLTETGTSLIRAVTAAGVAQTIFRPSAASVTVMSDSHGIWVADAFSLAIYLWQGTSAQRLGGWASGGLLQFAGPCE